ncbi:MAG TPA: hypothetical protein VI603_19045 [Saprospiraceae bacterium]|nr:hypothetical protein [Saprospiraceae bacterium]
MLSRADNGGNLFGEHIHYFKGNNTLEAPPQWNGNVSWMEWKVAGKPRYMDFSMMPQAQRDIQRFTGVALL